MPIYFRRSINLGILRVNLSRSGTSFTWRLGPWSWNSRTRRHSVDLPGPLSWRSRPARRTRARRRTRL